MRRRRYRRPFPVAGAALATAVLLTAAMLVWGLSVAGADGRSSLWQKYMDGTEKQRVLTRKLD